MQGDTDIVNNQWFTDYTKLGTSAAVFYGYTFILSLILWLGLRYMRAELKLVNMFCVYGEITLTDRMLKHTVAEGYGFDQACVRSSCPTFTQLAAGLMAFAVLYN
jgi:hypothetical protein